MSRYWLCRLLKAASLTPSQWPLAFSRRGLRVCGPRLCLYQTSASASASAVEPCICHDLCCSTHAKVRKRCGSVTRRCPHQDLPGGQEKVAFLKGPVDTCKHSHAQGPGVFRNPYQLLLARIGDCQVAKTGLRKMDRDNNRGIPTSTVSERGSSAGDVKYPRISAARYSYLLAQHPDMCGNLRVSLHYPPSPTVANYAATSSN